MSVINGLAVGFATLAAASPAPAHHHAVHHRGCNTRACDHRIDREWAAKQRRRQMRRLERFGALTPAVASWFQDRDSAGNNLGTACGFIADVGMANKTLPCGTVVHMCVDNGHRRCAGPLVGVTVEDRGPFIAGRSFDLNAGAKSALGCSDLCHVMANEGVTG